MTTSITWEIVGTQTAPKVYLANVCLIPKRLMGREITTDISESLAAHLSSGCIELNAATLPDLNGNDTILFAPGHGRKSWHTLTFKKLVEMRTSMGEGALYANDQPVAGSPVLDFDWQDAEFDETMDLVSNFMLHHNK